MSRKKSSTSSSIRYDEDEDSRKQIYSALVMILRGKLGEKEKTSSFDGFWGDLNSLISKHESNIDRITVQAVNVRSKLSNSRLLASKQHSERMAKAQKELQKLNQELSDLAKSDNIEKTNSYKRKENELKGTNEKLKKEINELGEKVQKIRQSTEEARAKLSKSSAKYEARSNTLKSKARSANDELNSAKAELQDMNYQLKKAQDENNEINKRYDIVSQMLSTFTEPLPSIKRIFSK